MGALRLPVKGPWSEGIRPSTAARKGNVQLCLLRRDRQTDSRSNAFVMGEKTRREKRAKRSQWTLHKKDQQY